MCEEWRLGKMFVCVAQRLLGIRVNGICVYMWEVEKSECICYTSNAHTVPVFMYLKTYFRSQFVHIIRECLYLSVFYFVYSFETESLSFLSSFYSGFFTVLLCSTLMHKGDHLILRLTLTLFFTSASLLTAYYSVKSRCIKRLLIHFKLCPHFPSA